MLYISTRNNSNTYTAHVAVKTDLGTDGGRFIPFNLPKFTASEVLKLREKSYNQVMAEILNTFFSGKLTGWDIDFIIGKSTFRKALMNHKIIISELWHNAESEYICTVKQIQSKLFPELSAEKTSCWMNTAVRIATLFAMYAELHAEQLLPADDAFDLVVPADDMLWPTAALIAKQMGLPAKAVVFACCEDNSIWDLIYKGTFSGTNMSPVFQAGVETAIYYMLGADDASLFRAAMEAGRSYSVENPESLPDCVHCTVAGDKRIQAEINSTFRNNGYITDPTGAMSISGAKDYRAKTGNGRIAILISESSPLNHKETILKATGIHEDQLLQTVKH